ncbi:A disintegrin and metalloproteinase with thrombospondin motifs 9 [Drosophila innubila]|uniref:A disintegrin and metalloproteinase with thrombospondin motifs 9 n=1 Tax=Drosophila innubila TaxID=198719 RepID=UPI00148E1EA5|nr:A disintegrin and metalloproteinase with thrombospondin motifs 9 [Drosophila innubila]
MSNASPGTETGSTLPAEDHRLLRHGIPYEELQRESKEKEEEEEQTDTFAALDDNVLRYSYKGTPPELYSPKKEFIYTQPLVEKQLVLKKSCEWMFYKYKYSQNMSTHWRQPASILISLLVLFTIGGIIFLLSSAPSHSTSIRLDNFDRQISKNFNNDTIVINWSDKTDIESDHVFGNIQDIGDDNLSTFVTPIKVHNISLNEEDLLYESKRNSDSSSQRDATSAFSMTGTFRNKSSEIWDPHPEYVLKVFNQRLHLVLHQDTSFIPSNTFRVIRILNNRTEESDEEEQGYYLGCYYKGHVEGDNQSAVAVRLCGGMTGYIKTSFGTLLIQPVNQTNGDEILHRVWRHSQRNPRHAVSDLDMALEEFELAANKQPLLTRSKRHFLNTGNQVYTLEVLIAVDQTMIEFHQSDLHSFILTLFSIVSNIFSDASIGNSIHISLINLLKLSDPFPHERGKNYAPSEQKLKRFCTFLSKQGYHYDTAMLITRDQICSSEREERCSTLGLAELGTVCKARSCSIVQDNGLPAAFTIAHELGHILNMPHDDDDRCKRHNTKSGKNRTLHIMSSIMGDHMHPWSWSKCSQHYVSEFLEKMDKSCLENTPTREYWNNLNTKLPGEIYSLDHQCQLIHGNQSTHCTFETECRRLFCNANSHPNELCRSSNLPWADGTPCNNDRYWCQRGHCVPRGGNSDQIVHGGWGPWSEFTPCSLTCGGGVQESRRECNNPVPSNGGKYCNGSRKKYRSCNTFNCPLDTPDPREQQCYDMNGKNFKIPGISPASKWIPKYGLNTHETDKCKLYCRLEDDSAYFKLQERVKDGTTCNVDSFDNNVENVTLRSFIKCFDNDTCTEVNGLVYVSELLKQERPPQSLYYITTIPKGASNIIITQPGYPDQNYIVISNDQHVPLINSVKVVTPYAKKYSHAGVTMDYNGSNSTIERVSTTYSFKTTRNLVLELISIDLSAAKKQDTVLLKYTYTLDKPKTAEPEVVMLNRWQMQTWSSCDSLCQGTMHRQAACISTNQGVKVANQFCDKSSMPNTEYRDCNTDCVLTLNTTSISECSAACGELGTREKKFNCIQTFTDIQRSNIVDMSYCQLKYEIVRHEQCREGCWNYTDWSKCTKTCGTGSQVREVRCFLNGTPVGNELCNSRTKNEFSETLRACSIEPCRFYPDVTINTRSVNHWLAGEWGECSEWCKMNRTVSCTHPYGNQCPLDKKPKAVRNCCHIKYTSEWEKCSVECGTGIKRKLQRCTRVYKPEVPGAPKRREYIGDSFCTTLKVRKPTLRKSTKVCKINCRWNSSEWSRCSKDCAEEYQTRFVHCEAWQGNRVSEQHCEGKRPINRKICSNCVRRQYKVLTPCDCSGYERRRILYYDSQRRRVAGKPKVEKHKCTPPLACSSRSLMSNSKGTYSYAENVNSRSAQSCADVQRMYRIYKDGDYSLQVRSRQVRIYCHQMNTAAPKEYITVEPQENYSIYYEYKTRNIDSCPPESRAHEYANPQNSGRTHFSKLRLNISELRIVENDFEFAESRGNRQALGSAGDCYNRNMNCPQGDFSISLQRTGFAMRPGTVWNTYGSRAIMKRTSDFDTSPFSRRAFCGGFCGRCSISASSGLYVEAV